jgi:photosystem I subunit 10
MASQLSAAVPQFHGLRGYASPRSVVAMPSVRVGRKRSQGIRCDYIGSATNLVCIYIYICVKYI